MNTPIDIAALLAQLTAAPSPTSTTTASSAAATPAEVSAELQAPVEPAPNPIEAALAEPLPSQSVENQAYLASVMPKVNATVTKTEALASQGQATLNSIQENVTSAKGGTASLYKTQQEASALDEQMALEVARRTQTSKDSASAINSVENMTLYQQAQQNARMEAKEVAGYNEVLQDPNASIFSKVAAHFKRAVMGQDQANSAHNNLARIQQGRNAAVLDHINTVAQVQSDYKTENIEQFAALQRRKENATNLVNMNLQNISLDAKSLSGMVTQMGLERDVTSELGKGLDSLKKIDQFTQDNVQQLLYSAQVKQAEKNLAKTRKAETDEKAFFEREKAYFDDFKATTNDPNIGNLTVQEFFGDNDALRAKTGKPMLAMEKYLIYRDNKALPSTAPVTDLLRREATGNMDINNPDSYSQVDKTINVLLEESIQEYNKELKDSTQAINRYTMNEAQIKELDKKVTAKMANLNNDITPLLRNNIVQYHDLNAVMAASKQPTPEGERLKGFMDDLFTPEEMALIESGEMDKVTTSIAPDAPNKSIGAVVTSVMGAVLKVEDPQERKNKMRTYASILAKNAETQTRLAIGQGNVGLSKGATITGVKDFALDRPVQGTGSFQLDSSAAWLDLMENYELKQKSLSNATSTVLRRF